MPVLPTIQYTPQQGLSPLETSGLKEVTSGVSDALQQIPKSMQRDRLQSSIDSANELFNETIEENIEGLPEPQQKKIRTAWRVNSAEFANLRNKENLTSDDVARETARLFNPILDKAIEAKENYKLQTTEDVRATGIEYGKSPKEVEVEVARRGLVDAGNVAEIAMEEASKSSDGKIEWQRLVELTKDKNRAVLSDPNIMTLVRDIPDPLKKAQMEYYKAKAGAERAKKQADLTGYTDVVKNMLPLAKYYREIKTNIVNKRKNILDQIFSMSQIDKTSKNPFSTMMMMNPEDYGKMKPINEPTAKDVQAFFSGKVGTGEQKQFNQLLKEYKLLDNQLTSIGTNQADKIIDLVVKDMGAKLGAKITDLDAIKATNQIGNTAEGRKSLDTMVKTIPVLIERDESIDRIVDKYKKFLEKKGYEDKDDQMAIIIATLKEALKGSPFE